MELYGTKEPPPYNLTNVRANIHIMHGTTDWLTPSRVSILYYNIVYLHNNSKNSMKFVWILKINSFFPQNVPLLAKAMGRYPIAISKFPGYNHIDFAYGSNLDMVHRKMFKVEKLVY